MNAGQEDVGLEFLPASGETLQKPEVPAQQKDQGLEFIERTGLPDQGKTQPPPTTPTAKPTMYQQARTAPRKPERELTWSETGQQALRNLPSR